MERKISIIIPIYNAQECVFDSFKSLSNQTFENFEVICINDGSTDNTQEILEKYAQSDPRFKIFKIENSGAGHARNHGLTKVSGQFVQFLDADDYYEPKMLEILLSCIEKHNADFVVCSAYGTDEKGQITVTSNPNWPIAVDLAKFNTAFNPLEFKNEIFNMFCVVPWTKLYSRDFLLKNNLEYQNIPSSNDVAFSYNARVCAQKIVIIPDKLVHYKTKRTGSISEFRANKTINVILASKFVKDFLISKNLYDTYKTGYLSAFNNMLKSALSLCNKEQYENFITEIKKLPQDIWEDFSTIINTKPEFYIEKFGEIIKNKKVILWGASIFIQKIIKEGNFLNNNNILGFVDKNKAMQGTKICGYSVFSPEKIKEIAPEAVLMSVYSKSDLTYQSIKKEMAQICPNIELLENIFT